MEFETGFIQSECRRWIEERRRPPLVIWNSLNQLKSFFGYRAHGHIKFLFKYNPPRGISSVNFACHRVRGGAPLRFCLPVFRNRRHISPRIQQKIVKFYKTSATGEQSVTFPFFQQLGQMWSERNSVCKDVLSKTISSSLNPNNQHCAAN